MPEKILVVHGYGFVNENDLGVQSGVVLDKVLEIQDRFDEIILLGGWHDQNQSPLLTSGIIMKRMLIEKGVDLKKLACFDDLCNWGIPPIDTAGEVDLFLKTFKFKEISSEDVFYAVGLWYHIPRIKLLYRLKGLKKVKFIPVFSCKTLHPNQWLRILQEPVGLLINWLDPNGCGWFMRRLRKNRTHCGTTP